MHVFAAQGRAVFKQRLLERLRDEVRAEFAARGQEASEAEIERIVELRRRAYYTRLSLSAARARQKARESKKTAAATRTSAAVQEISGDATSIDAVHSPG